MVSLVCGVIGIVLPLLPTTPFLLVSAFAFARSSPRFHDWLISHPTLGPPIHDWNANGAIRRSTKILALTMIAATFAGSVYFGVSPTILAIQGVVLGCVTIFILTRPEPTPS